MSAVPQLFVEGHDDVAVISNLLARHGVKTMRGGQILKIVASGNIDTLLDDMPLAIRAHTDMPVGFVVDIDIELTNRWDAVSDRLKRAGITPPPKCPDTGYFGRVPGYAHNVGVWLMPDCSSDGCKMEHLIKSLLPHDDPLWPHAQNCANEAKAIVDAANNKLAGEEPRWEVFREVDRIKSEVHSWLAWQRMPGLPFGAAINDHILGSDSPQALALLRWLRDLYSLDGLSHL